MEKMTNKKALEFVLSLEVVAENVEVSEKLAKMLEQVEKKSAKKSDKPTKAQVENEDIKGRILVILSESEAPCQIKEICAKLDNEFSNQKISALVRQLVTIGMVERIEVKKVAMFKNVE